MTTTTAFRLQPVTTVGFVADQGGRGFHLPTDFAIRGDGRVFVASRSHSSALDIVGIQMTNANHEFFGPDRPVRPLRGRHGVAVGSGAGRRRQPLPGRRSSAEDHGLRPGWQRDGGPGDHRAMRTASSTAYRAWSLTPMTICFLSIIATTASRSSPKTAGSSRSGDRPERVTGSSTYHGASAWTERATST